MNIENERKLFLDWHFNDWKLSNASNDTVEFARELYDRIYKHNHNQFFREREFRAWQASANREGFVLVPVKPTDEMIDSMYDEDGMYIDEIDGTPESFYKAMIKASQENKDD